MEAELPQRQDREYLHEPALTAARIRNDQNEPDWKRKYAQLQLWDSKYALKFLYNERPPAYDDEEGCRKVVEELWDTMAPIATERRIGFETALRKRQLKSKVTQGARDARRTALQEAKNQPEYTGEPGDDGRGGAAGGSGV